MSYKRYHTTTQKEAILEMLKRAGTDGVTPVEALLTVGSLRLGARIWDLRADGYDIRTESVTNANGSRIARYVLQP